MVRVEVVALGCDTSVVVFRQRVERSVESARLAEGERLDLGDPGGELRLEREIRAVQPYETDRRSGRHVSPADMRVRNDGDVRSRSSAAPERAKSRPPESAREFHRRGAVHPCMLGA